MPGRFVVCVDARNSGGYLRKGAVYPVVEERGEFLDVGIAAVRHPGFYRFRFRPAPDLSALRSLLKTAPAGVPA